MPINHCVVIHDETIITAPLHCCDNANSNPDCPKTAHIRTEIDREYSCIVY